jgi:hypothetical protein
MPELTPEQKAQLDKNIRAMLEQGASEDDIKAYASDFRLRFDVKKKEVAPAGVKPVPAPLSAGGAAAASSASPLPLFGTPKAQPSDKIGQQLQVNAANGKLAAPDSADDESVTLNGVRLKTSDYTRVDFPLYDTDDDPVKTALASDRNYLREMSEQTRTTESTRQGSAKQTITTQEVNAVRGAEMRIRASMFYNGDEAALYLNKKLGTDITALPDEALDAAIPKNNETMRLALDEVRGQRAVERALKTSPSLEEAAFKWAVGQNPHLRAQGDKLLESGLPFTQAVPEAMRGQILYQFLQDKSLNHLAQKNPELNSKLQGARTLLLQHYPDFGEMVVASKIAQWREAAGENNGVLNVVGAEATDKMLQQKLAQKKLTPEEYRLYKERIEPTLGLWNSLGRGVGNLIPGVNQFVNNAKIKTPGFGENLVEGLESSEVGIAATLATPVRQFYKDEGDQLHAALDKDYATPQFTPRGLIHQIGNYGGQVTGQVLPMGVGAKGLQALSLAKNAQTGTAIMGGLMSYSANREEALKTFPDEPLKQHGFALGATVIDMASEALFPNEVAAVDALRRAAKPRLAGVIQDFTAGRITAAAAKKSVVDIVTDAALATAKFTGKTVKGANKEGVEELVASVSQSGLKAIFEGQSPEFTRVANDAFHAYQQGLLGGLVVSAVAAAGDRRQMATVGESLWEMAGNPHFYETKIKELAAADPEVAKTADESLQRLQFAAGVRRDLRGLNLSEEDSRDYLLHALNEQVLTEQAEGLTDPTLKKKSEEGIKRSQQIKEEILARAPKTETAPLGEKPAVILPKDNKSKETITVAPKAEEGAKERGVAVVMPSQGRSQVITIAPKEPKPAESKGARVILPSSNGGPVVVGRKEVGETSAVEEAVSETLPQEEAAPVNIADIGAGFTIHRGVTSEAAKANKSGFYSYDKDGALGYAEGNEANVISGTIAPNARVLRLVDGTTDAYEANDQGVAELKKIIGKKAFEESYNPDDPSDITDVLWGNEAAVEKLRKKGIDVVVGNSMDGISVFVVNPEAITEKTTAHARQATPQPLPSKEAAPASAAVGQSSKAASETETAGAEEKGVGETLPPNTVAHYEGENNTRAVVMKAHNGFRVGLQDMDSGSFVPRMTTYPTQEWADAEARKLVGATAADQSPESASTDTEKKVSSKGVMKKARDIEDLTEPEDLVMQHFVGGGAIHPSAIQEIFGGAGKSTEGEKRARIDILSSKAPTIDALAHQLWEADPTGQYTTEDYKDAIERVVWPKTWWPDLCWEK